ncbi:hypothetical protein D3C81_2301590 [compost metagenome]
MPGVYGQKQIFQRGQAADQIGILENQSDLVPAQRRQLLFLAEIHLPAIHIDTA